MKRYQSALKQWWEKHEKRVERGAYQVGRVLFWAGAAALALLFLGLAISLLIWLLSEYLWQCLGAILIVVAGCCVMTYIYERWPEEPRNDLAWGPDVDPPTR